MSVTEETSLAGRCVAAHGLREERQERSKGWIAMIVFVESICHVSKHLSTGSIGILHVQRACLNHPLESLPLSSQHI